MAKITYEFWAISESGDKYHEYITTKSSRESKVKTQITEKYNLDISKCRDFGIRKIN